MFTAFFVLAQVSKKIKIGHYLHDLFSDLSSKWDQEQKLGTKKKVWLF